MTLARCGLGGLALLIGMNLLAADTPSPRKGKEKLSAPEKKLLELTNQARKKHKLPPLQSNALLDRVARAHSANMARQDKLEHVLDGKENTDRMDAAGYRWQDAAENLAFVRREDTLPEVVQGWLKSPGHRDNLLSPDFTETGIGIARGKKGTLYLTQIFAIPEKAKKK